MKDKKKIILRILKEIGRFALVFAVGFGILLLDFWMCCGHQQRCFRCFQSERTLEFFLYIIVCFLLIPLIYHKKLSKIWIIDLTIIFLLILGIRYIFDYVTRAEVQPSSSEFYDTVLEAQQYEKGSEGL